MEPQFGEKFMHAQRPVAKTENLTNGPGKLCSAMSIDHALDGANLCDATSQIFLAQNPDLEKFLNQRGPMITTTRIGITKAAHLPLRFYLDGSRFVSKRATANSS